MYSEFAEVYDLLIDNDYESFASYYEDIFRKYSLNPHLVADLGCGTGTLTDIMHKKGYDVIGIDASEEMLSVAASKYSDILFLNQPVTEFELYGTVDAMYSSLDCVNYLIEDGEIDKLFTLVKNYLNPGGIFIFDISSYYKISEVLGNNTFIFEFNDVFYTWENSFEDNVLTLDLTFFKKEGNMYRRFDESQVQRAYTEKEITDAAQNEGLKVLGVFDSLSFDKPHKETERIFFVLQKEDI